MYLVLLAAALAVSCGRPAPPATQTHLVHLAVNGATVGEERLETTVEGQRQTLRTDTILDGPSAVRLRGELLIERGRPISLQVSGTAPPGMPAEVHVTATPDRTDTFLIRSPLPVHVLAALVRTSIVGARRDYRLLPEGRAGVRPCEGIDGPFPEATCHAVSGLPSGPALVWLDRRQALAAAVISTPWGTLVANTPERDDSRSALLERFDVYSARQ